MKTVSFVTSKLYQNNIIFDRNQTKVIIRDNVFDKYYELHDEFKKNGFNIATNDINSVQDSDYVIYVDLPKKCPLKKDEKKSFLILSESPLIRPDNYDVSNHECYKKIFTWNDDLVDNKKYIKINCAFKMPDRIPKIINKEKLVCLIVGNKSSAYQNELYTERKIITRWFECNHPNEFDLYGVGWNEYIFRGSRLMRALNRVPFAKNIMYKLIGEFYPSYKGKVDNKFEVMKDYKFSICYENIKDAPGYITDKLLDAFFAGCVPIYWGAGNVADHVPKECFIDKRKFKTYKELYSYMKDMTNDVYMEYLNNIEKFLTSHQGKQFSSECFAEIIVSEVVEEGCA